MPCKSLWNTMYIVCEMTGVPESLKPAPRPKPVTYNGNTIETRCAFKCHSDNVVN